MAFPVGSCAVVGRFTDARVAETVNALLPHLLSRGVQVLVSTASPEFGAAGAAGVVRVSDAAMSRSARSPIAAACRSSE